MLHNIVEKRMFQRMASLLWSIPTKKISWKVTLLKLDVQYVEVG